MPRRQIPTHEPPRIRAVPGRRPGRWRSVFVVLSLVLGWCLLPAIAPSAAADGYGCKDVPTPQYPDQPQAAQFDRTAKNARGDGTGYGSYGWAGLRWEVYDLGCGPDITRAPGAVADNELGNEFMAWAESIAGTAIWLDRQVNTDDGSGSTVHSGVFQQLDHIVDVVVGALRGPIYEQFMLIALVVVGSIILWRAVQGDTANVMRNTMIGGIALLLGGLLVGVPQKAIQIADDTFASTVTGTQNEILTSAGYDAKAGPRNVLLDKIIIPGWDKGWFGDNEQASQKHGVALRDSLAFTYDQQDQVQKDRSKEKDLSDKKADAFKDIVSGLEGDGVSYFQFQGKSSGRAGTGFMTLVQSASVSLVWIAANLLKLLGLLVIRFAILFAPIWVPAVAVSGSLLQRVFRVVASAMAWAIAGAVILSAYLIFVVTLYRSADVDGTWRLWLTILVGIICWSILRPFKRISQTLRQNKTGVLGGMTRAGIALLSGGTGALAGAAAGRAAGKDHDSNDGDPSPKQAPPRRPEGTGPRRMPRRPAVTAASTRPALGAAPRREEPLEGEVIDLTKADRTKPGRTHTTAPATIDGEVLDTADATDATAMPMHRRRPRALAAAPSTGQEENTVPGATGERGQRGLAGAPGAPGGAGGAGGEPGTDGETGTSTKRTATAAQHSGATSGRPQYQAHPGADVVGEPWLPKGERHEEPGHGKSATAPTRRSRGGGDVVGTAWRPDRREEPRTGGMR